MKQPSTRQRVLHFISRFWHEYNYPPTIGEIAHGLNFNSTETARYHLRELRTAGTIEWQPGHERTIRLKEAA